MSLFPQLHRQKHPKFTATFWVAVNHVSMFPNFLIFACFALVYSFPLLLYISKPKLYSPIEVCCINLCNDTSKIFPGIVCVMANPSLMEKQTLLSCSWRKAVDKDAAFAPQEPPRNRELSEGECSAQFLGLPFMKHETTGFNNSAKEIFPAQ